MTWPTQRPSVIPQCFFHSFIVHNYFADDVQHAAVRAGARALAQLASSSPQRATSTPPSARRVRIEHASPSPARPPKHHNPVKLLDAVSKGVDNRIPPEKSKKVQKKKKKSKPVRVLLLEFCLLFVLTSSSPPLLGMRQVPHTPDGVTDYEAQRLHAVEEEAARGSEAGVS
jgi:hypothetical protein